MDSTRPKAERGPIVRWLRPRTPAEDWRTIKINLTMAAVFSVLAIVISLVKLLILG